MIDAVLFDLYETLITEAPAAPTRASSLFAPLGLERQAYRAEWKARRPRIVVGELSFAGALAEISNGFKEDVLPWAGCALAPAFQCTAFSCDEGIAKPDREIYVRALRRLGVQPDTTIYVGDGGDNELAGAERAGLRACRAAWFAPASAQALPWPELTRCDEVLTLVAAG